MVHRSSENPKCSRLAIAAAIPGMQPERFVPFAPHGAVGVGQAAAILFWSYT